MATALVEQIRPKERDKAVTCPLPGLHPLQPTLAWTKRTTIGVVVSSAIVIPYDFVAVAVNLAHFFVFPVDFSTSLCIIEGKESQEVSLCGI